MCISFHDLFVILGIEMFIAMMVTNLLLLIFLLFGSSYVTVYSKKKF